MDTTTSQPINSQLERSVPAIATHHLTRHYPVPGRKDRVVALSGVDLTVTAGSFTAVVGASGSGKSTLLHCVAGLDRPDEGQVHLLGQQTTHLRRRQLAGFRARHVGFIFQEYNLVQALTAAQNVALPAELAGHPLSRRQVLESLERVGLAHRAGQLPHQLSGGERQRVAVARVMAARPELVFADEPTGALDPTSSGIVLGWLAELAAAGSTVLMVTHDVAAAAGADEVLVMHAGRLAGRVPGGDEDRVQAAMWAARHHDARTSQPA